MANIENMIEMLEEKMLAGFFEIRTDIKGMKADISNIKIDVSDLKADVSVLKTDVSVLKTDVSVLKTDVSVLKNDVSFLKFDNGSIRQDQKAFYREFTEFKSECYSHFDALYKLVESFRDHEYFALSGGVKRLEAEHKIIDHPTILREISSLKNSLN